MKESEEVQLQQRSIEEGFHLI